MIPDLFFTEPCDGYDEPRFGADWPASVPYRNDEATREMLDYFFSVYDEGDD